MLSRLPRFSMLQAHHSPPTLPVSTVIDALGSNTFWPGVQSASVRLGGPSGSAWLVAPELCQIYSAAPKVTVLTVPVKCMWLGWPPSSKEISAWWALLGSLLMISSDHAPSGRLTA
jgi:hypothetical protein